MRSIGCSLLTSGFPSISLYLVCFSLELVEEMSLGLDSESVGRFRSVSRRRPGSFW